MRAAVVAISAMLGWTAVASSAASPRLVIEFVPESAAFSGAAAEYERIWARDGDRIVAALQEATGLTVESSPIKAIVLEAPSSSGYRSIPMRLRASYAEPTKRGTLVHELGHRLLGDLVDKDFEDHPIVFLFLYDVWVHLYGKAFADSQVVVESQRKGIYDYDAAWRAALALPVAERAAKLRAFIVERRGGPTRS
jgi:hypothetical protein